MKKADILFIINPTSGRGPQADIPGMVNRFLDQEKYRVQIAFTQYAGHATELARAAADAGYAVVVAVGGDGTVNEAASALVHTDTALAILPKGSGNGLARHLRVPLSLPKAVSLLNTGIRSRIDSGTINGRPFFCTAGIGFDAYISSLFSTNKRRGLRTYVELVLKKLFAYKPQPGRIQMAGNDFYADCFVLAFANAAQYGNNAYIAPMANIRDGLLDMCLIRKITVPKAIQLAYGMFTNQMIGTSGAQYFRSAAAEVHFEKPMKFHADGEYLGEATDFNVQLYPLSLHVIVPETV